MDAPFGLTVFWGHTVDQVQKHSGTRFAAVFFLGSSE